MLSPYSNKLPSNTQTIHYTKNIDAVNPVRDPKKKVSNAVNYLTPASNNHFTGRHFAT